MDPSPPGVSAAGHAFESTVSVAFTIAVILIAAHIALVRFQPMLSSRAMAHAVNQLTAAPANADAQLMLYGDQADGSSLIFYTRRLALTPLHPSWCPSAYPVFLFPGLLYVIDTFFFFFSFLYHSFLLSFSRAFRAGEQVVRSGPETHEQSGATGIEDEDEPSA